MDDITQDHADFVGLAAAIVGAYVAKNNIPASELPGLIVATHAALAKLTVKPEPAVERPTPPVPIRKTVTPDYIISLEDGKSYRSLKRHLTTRGLTPAEYRQKWGLPHDYPMVAATYAAQRSELAKSFGLGQIRHNQAEARKVEAGVKLIQPVAPRRGRTKKAQVAAAE
ncbi:MucR family transcriptional regulator [Methylobacterium sp. SyP6R]|uniref:MucR family transcriptional regulator n=1 Tax=Methylobacterium sp. SyP6R TaxID=2718876 RepID=UPI001F38CE7B|nr:MucR family transcriptional regulator [Methylobacterium sp. SyP6R]MCF4130152.1 MucR family transcriptional regulator [Methylobacterium sp. SyP6R]